MGIPGRRPSSLGPVPLHQPPRGTVACVSPTPGRSGIWLVLLAIASVQFGAAVAKDLFGVVPPLSMVWLRLAAASLALLVLLAVCRARTVSRIGRGLRPQIRDTVDGPAPAARNWPDGLAYSVCLVGMNVSSTSRARLAAAA